MITPDKYIVTPEGHWLWLGYCDSKGYGVVRDRKSVRKAHRVMYEQIKQVKISVKIDLHHRCKFKNCINPDCVEQLTKAEHNKLTHNSGNNLGNVNRNKTHCPRGHEYTAENTRIILAGRGRVCKVCKRQKMRTQSLFKKLVVR